MWLLTLRCFGTSCSRMHMLALAGFEPEIIAYHGHQLGKRHTTKQCSERRILKNLVIMHLLLAAAAAFVDVADLLAHRAIHDPRNRVLQTTTQSQHKHKPHLHHQGHA